MIYYRMLLRGLAKHYKADLDAPFGDLPERVQNVLLHGSGGEEIEFTYWRKGAWRKMNKPFEGVIPNLERLYEETDSEFTKARLQQFMVGMPCPDCKGARLRPESLAVTVGGKSIIDVTRLSVEEAARFFQSLEGVAPATPTPEQRGWTRALHPHRSRATHRLSDSERDHFAADLLEERRPRLPHARPPKRHAFGRRSATDSAGHANRRGPGRRALRAGRTEHRASPTRQPAAARNAERLARSRQHRARRRARRRHDSRRRLHCRSRSRRGRARRLRRGGRPAADDSRIAQIADGRVPARRTANPRSEGSSRAEEGLADNPRRARKQSQEHRCPHSAGLAHVRDRRERFGQEHAGGRHSAQGAVPKILSRQGSAGRSRRHHRLRRTRQGHRDRPIADWPHAALQSRDLHRARSTTSAISSPNCPTPACAATGRGGSASTSKAAAAKRAKATASSASRCIFCPTCT